MSEWAEKRLEDFIDVNPTVKLKKGQDYPFIDIDKVSPSLRTVTNEETLLYNGQGGSKFCDGDTVFARITPCLENRKIAQVRIGPQIGFGSTEFYVFRAKQGLADEDFTYYLTSSDAVVLPAINSMSGASGRQRADKRFIQRIKLTVPDLPTQKRIAHTLSAYDNLIEINNKRIKVLEQMAEEVYKEWFVRFRFPGYENAEFVDGLPKGWSTQRLSDILEVCYGKDHKEIDDGNIPIYGSGGIMRYGNKAIYSGESVLVPRKGTLNNIMYVSRDFWTVDTMFYSKPLLPHIAKYMYYTLSRIDMESYNSGAALPSMTTDILNRFKVILPSTDIRERFDIIIDGFYSQKDTLIKQNENLIKQRDLLLPRLMSGKLEV